MQGTQGRRPWAAITAGLAVAGLLSIVAAQLASARTGTTCNGAANTAEFTFDDQGLKARVSISYNEDFMMGDKIAASYKGTNQGIPVSGAAGCTDPDPYAAVSVVLGDRDDKARLDAKRPASLDFQATDPLPSFVAATINGNGGADVLRGHKGLDTISGRGGADVIHIEGGGADTAKCGPGKDTVFLSGADQAVGCERGVTGIS